MIPEGDLIRRLERCREGARDLRAADTRTKNQALLFLAQRLRDSANQILAANAEDLAAFDQTPAKNPAFRDRLLLDRKRIEQMAVSLEQVAALADPVGEVVDAKTLSNGLRLKRVRSPLGVIFMIFESRPNVAIEAFSLAFKSGNAIILRGGKESLKTVSMIYSLIEESLRGAGAPENALWGITDPDRAISQFLLTQRSYIDVVVPRGGDSLIEYVVKNSHIPIIKNDRGMCHVFVNGDADLAMAASIVKNSKCQRPSVCNAAETVLVHAAVARRFVPALYDQLAPMKVQWFACPETLKILGGRADVFAAQDSNWDTEYLDLRMNCKVVENLDEAITHIEKHGSRHSESIVTASEPAARRFQNEIDAAVVYWNASTRFTDGFELGLGGELGISTQKLHVRGPVGLRELTSVRWIGDGTGQIRN